MTTPQALTAVLVIAHMLGSICVLDERYSAGVVLEARAVAVSNKQWRAEVAAHVRLVCLACQRVWRGFLTPNAKAHAGFS